jgi:hypothetical protein
MQEFCSPAARFQQRSIAMHDASHHPVEDDDFDYDALPADYYDDRLVTRGGVTRHVPRLIAGDFPDLRSALRVAQKVPPEKWGDFWRGSPWEKKKSLKGKGDGKRDKAKQRVVKEAPPKPDASAASAPKPSETPTLPPSLLDLLWSPTSR